MVVMKRCIFAVLLATGCKHAPSEDQCKQLLDHLVDLEFRKAGATVSGDGSKAELAKQKQAVSEAKANDFIELCVKRIARARVECSLSAADSDAVARCDG
jgi:hypothetical protein